MSLAGLLFFVSGAAGLVYENVWIKQLGLLLGNTSLATTLVLTAFMGGLALGSWLAGRAADRLERPLRVYGWLELAVAVAAMAFPGLVDLVRQFQLDVLARGGLSAGAQEAFLFVALLGLLAVPTALMGATLPVLCRFVIGPAGAGRALGWLYGVNSFGAVFGCLATAFWFVPAYGLWASSFLAQAANAVVGLLAIAVDAAWCADAPVEAPAADPTEPPTTPPTPGPAAPEPALTDPVLVAVLVSGFAAMVYEVALLKVLPMILGSSVYSFALMVSAFITGIALGSSIAGAVTPHLARPVRALAWLQLAAGLAFLAIVPTFNLLPVVYGLARVSFAGSFAVFELFSLGLCFALMVGPTLALGAVLPVAAEALGRGRARAPIGRLYGTNTLGNIAGTLLTGLVLIPRVGYQLSMELGILLNLAAGAWLLVREPGRGTHTALGVTAAILSLYVLVHPTLDPLLLSAGTYRGVDGRSGPITFANLRAGREILFAREDVTGFVTLERRQGDGSLALRVNGKVDASSGRDMTTQKLIAHLPLLWHPAPKRVFVLGLGSGATAGAALTHGVERVDCAEISPAVAEAARFFSEVNGDPLPNPRLRLAIDDGRQWLTRSDGRFDVIISEPTNPWIAGITNLFSLEYFGIVRDHLAPRGIACQWLHSYEMDPDTFRIVLRTFMQVFPHVVLFTSARADVVMLGSMDPLDVSLPELDQRMAPPAVKADLASIGVRSPLHMMLHYLSHGPDLEAFAGQGEVNSDDWPVLEYRAPRGFFARANVPLPDWERRAHSPHSLIARALAARPPTIEQRYELLAHVTDEFGEDVALTCAEEIVSDAPQHVGARRRLAELLRGSGERRAALTHAQEAARLAPTDPDVQRLLFEIAFLIEENEVSLVKPRRFSVSTAAARAFVKLKPDDERGHVNLGAALFDSEDWSGAESSYARAFELSPRGQRRSAYYKLVIASCRLKRGDREGAARAFSEAGVTAGDLPESQREFYRTLTGELAVAFKAREEGR